jgi:hypothetical protein
MKHNIALDTATLQAALVGYQHQRDEIDGKIAELRKRIGGRGNGHVTVATPDTAPQKRQMSAAARKRIAAAQRKRWAAFHKAKEQ